MEEIEAFYEDELINYVGGIRNAWKYGFMTITNFMIEVKVSPRITRLLNSRCSDTIFHTMPCIFRGVMM